MPVQTVSMPRKKKELGTEVVRIDEDLVQMARVVLAARGRRGEKMALPDYLSRKLRGSIQKDYKQEVLGLAASDTGGSDSE